VDFSQPFWVLRVLAGLAMFGGLLAFLTNIVLTLRSPVPAAAPAPVAA
jgi:cbb3-type cytochrome oxidase subunit 1